MTEIILNQISKIEEIINNDAPLKNTLVDLDLRDIDEENYNFLLVNLLFLSYEKRNRSNTSIIIEHFEGYLYTELHIMLIIMKTASVIIESNVSDFLKFLFEIRDDVTTEGLIKNLIHWDSRPEVIALLKQIDELLPQLSYDEWKKLHIYAVAEAYINNAILIEYIESKLETISPTVKIPKWIINSQEKPITFREFNLPSHEEVVKILMNLTDLKQNQIEDQFMPEYRISTYEERCKMLKLKPDSKTILEDEEAFRRYGPLNTMNNTLGRDDDDPCLLGCRMLTCQDFPNYDQDLYDIDPDVDPSGETKEDWFMDNCMECQNKISSRQYALRIPQLDGGWRGCYCSFKCLAADIEALATFPSRMEDQLSKIGIYN